MIIILTGPTGVGKTDTSWALLQQFEQLVFLDADWFASRILQSLTFFRQDSYEHRPSWPQQ